MSLRRYTPMKPSRGTIIPPEIRREVMERDGYGCVCERAGFPPEVVEVCRQEYGLELDHVRASHGIGMKSRSTADNLVLLGPAAHRWKTLNGRTARPLLLAYLAQREDPR